MKARRVCQCVDAANSDQGDSGCRLQFFTVSPCAHVCNRAPCTGAGLRRTHVCACVAVVWLRRRSPFQIRVPYLPCVPQVTVHKERLISCKGNVDDYT